MATPPRMKIKVTDLIARIEKQHKDNVKEYDKRKRKYDREKASYLKLVAENVPRNREKVVEVIEREIKNLQKQRRDILAGKEDKHLLNGTYNAFDRYRYVNLENIVNDRPRPVEPREPAAPTALLEQLRMSSDDVISVTTAQFEQYLNWK